MTQIYPMLAQDKEESRYNSRYTTLGQCDKGMTDEELVKRDETLDKLCKLAFKKDCEVKPK